MTTPSGSAYQVTPADIAAAATSCTNTASQIDEQLSTLKSYVVNLESEWKGIAANTFTSLMTDYDTYAIMLHNALTDIASGLQGNYVNYTDAEQTNLNNLQTVNGSLPGANFS